MATKRIRTSTAKGDIENAFKMWKTAMAMSGDPLAFDEACQTESRVTAWLNQVDAMEGQLHKAMLACQAMVDAAEIRDDDSQAGRLEAATKLAREAIED